MGLLQGHDPHTLREIVDQAQCAARLEEIGAHRSLPALLERVWILNVLDRHDDAAQLAAEAVRLARMAGKRTDLLRARILHASVANSRGKTDAALKELGTCIDEAEGQGWLSIAALALFHRGRVHFSAGDIAEARGDFKRALFLRQESGASEAQLETILLAIDASDRRRAAVGE